MFWLTLCISAFVIHVAVCSMLAFCQSLLAEWDWWRYFISCISVNVSVITLCWFICMLLVIILVNITVHLFFSLFVCTFWVILFSCTLAVLHCHILYKYACTFYLYKTIELFVAGSFCLLDFVIIFVPNVRGSFKKFVALHRWAL